MSLDPDQDANLCEVILDVPSKQNPYKKPLNNCRRLVKERLNGKVTIRGLNKILDALLDCKVLHLPSRKISNPYTVFNTINNRGEELKPADLFKSLSIDLCKSKKNREDAAAVWRDISSSHINHDIRWWNVLRTGVRPPPKGTFDTLQETFEMNSSPGASALRLMKEIGRVTTGLTAVRGCNVGDVRGSYRNADWANAHIKRAIVELRIREVIPLFYAALVKCSKSPVFDKVVLSTVRVSMRLLKPKTGASRTLPVVFHKYAHEFWENGSAAYVGYKKALEGLIDDHCDDAQFEALINSLKYPVDNSTIRQLLIGIEESRAWLDSEQRNHVSTIDKSRVIHADVITLDHIIAQQRKPVNAHSIGNLTLMGRDPNNAAGNIQPQDKRALLACSPYAITRDVIQKRVWNDQTITDRQETLIGYAKRAFRPI